MSTRGCYRFSDGHNQGPFTVYKHSDNYPYTEHGGVAAIAKALDYAWPLPRYEADDFAAAFVSAHKPSKRDLIAYWRDRGVSNPESYAEPGVGGGVRLLNTPDARTLEHMPGDIEYLYDVSERGGKLWVVVSEIERPEGWSSDVMVAKKMADGTLADMLAQFAEWPKEDAA